AGVIWLCFTGGDPLTRKDFLDIYSYAKDKGFIITIFTNGYSMTEEIAEYFKKRTPFVIEMTLNAVTEDLYQKISQVKGSFTKVRKGIDLILKENLALKIKTEITKDNLGEFHKIQSFIEGLGLKFRPSSDLHARLNGDSASCNLRISPQEVLCLNGKRWLSDNDCRLSQKREDTSRLRSGQGRQKTDLFHCAIGGGDGINLDPCGNMFLCNLIRKPAFNLLKVDIEYASNKLLPLVRNKKFVSNSKCKGCNLREFCRWCPGRAYLEADNEEAPIPYYCERAKFFAKAKK
ncbi:MAG: radical SAM protein, partial [bacterium]